MPPTMPVFKLSPPGVPSRGWGGVLAATMVGLAFSVTGCGPDLPAFPPACPVTDVLSDAADLPRFRGWGTDLTYMVVDGRLAPPKGKFKLYDLTHLHTTISVSMTLTRGPAATSRTMDVTYFVSVSRGDKILDKKDYTLAVTFPPNSNRVSITSDPIDIVLPIDDKTSGVVYRVYDAFQLTPAELAFNRKRGVR